MEAILDWGVEVVLWWQQFSPMLDLPFKLFTFTGDAIFLVSFMALLYWVVNRKLGARLLLFLLGALCINLMAKWLAGQPRPYQYDPRVQAIIEAQSNGFPSGHTQNAIVMWGYLAYHYNRRWLWLVAALFFIMTPLSRVYLGVHFPIDLAGGYLMGIILLAIYLRQEDRIAQWLNSRPLAFLLFLAVVPPLFVLIMPIQSEDALTAAGAIAGLGMGMVLERRWVRFEISTDWRRRGASLLLGVVMILALYLGLRAIFDSVELNMVLFNQLDLVGLLRYLRYLIIGFCGMLLLPWLFIRLNLMEVR